MIWQRDRKQTFVLADSGGFSAVQDNLDVQWDIPESVDALRWELLKWLEKVPDAAVHLDIPLRAIGQSRHFRTFQQCLDMTVGNVRHWAENCRNPDLKWIMPIHGRTIQEAELWWNALKQTGASFDGIAIGGALGFDLSLILGVLVHIHQEGQLAACRLIHIFGHFSVNYFLTLSILQKVLNEHVNPDIRVTFDASSPFWDAEHGNICQRLIPLCPVARNVVTGSGRQLRT
jgi:hypothetical protein